MEGGGPGSGESGRRHIVKRVPLLPWREVFVFVRMDGAYEREAFILARLGRGVAGGRCFTADLVHSGESSALGVNGMGRRGDFTRPIFVNPETQVPGSVSVEIDARTCHGPTAVC